MGAWVTLEFFCLFVFWGLAFLVCCLVFTLSCKNSPSPFCPLPLPFTSSTYYHYFFLLLSTFTSMGFGWVFLFRARIFLGLFFFSFPSSFLQLRELSIYHSFFGGLFCNSGECAISGVFCKSGCVSVDENRKRRIPSVYVLCISGTDTGESRVGGRE